MKSYFASAERINGGELEREIESICTNPIINGLMNISSGLMTVINEHRQIVAINETYLKLIGISNIEEVLGLRVGESVSCIHSSELPGGCGTSKHCSKCGAVIAMVTSLEENKPVDDVCVVTVNKNGENVDLYFSIRSVPITLEKKQFLLLFLNDISNKQQWDTMERLFIHDINNHLNGIVGKCELLLLEQEDNEFIQGIKEQSLQIAQEFEIHKRLMNDGIDSYNPIYQDVTADKILQDVKLIFSNHEMTKNKILLFPENVPEVSLSTDLSLVLRVLGNMINNALEASENGDEVKFTIELENEMIIFSIRNRKTIPYNISKRIFQRNFTTKEGYCRGLGTYSMKLLGENMLGGKVSFTTSDTEGTVFQFHLAIQK